MCRAINITYTYSLSLPSHARRTYTIIIRMKSRRNFSVHHTYMHAAGLGHRITQTGERTWLTSHGLLHLYIGSFKRWTWEVHPNVFRLSSKCRMGPVNWAQNLPFSETIPYFADMHLNWQRFLLIECWLVPHNCSSYILHGQPYILMLASIRADSRPSPDI